MALSTGNASCDDKTKHASSSVSDSKAPLQLSEFHYCDILVKMADEGVGRNPFIVYKTVGPKFRSFRKI